MTEFNRLPSSVLEELNQRLEDQLDANRSLLFYDALGAEASITKSSDGYIIQHSEGCSLYSDWSRLTQYSDVLEAAYAGRLEVLDSAQNAIDVGLDQLFAPFQQNEATQPQSSQIPVELLIEKLQSQQSLSETEQQMCDRMIAQVAANLIAFRSEEIDKDALMYRAEHYTIMCDSVEPNDSLESGTDYISIYSSDSPIFRFISQSSNPDLIEVSACNPLQQIELLQAYQAIQIQSDKASQTPIQIVQNDLDNLSNLAPLGSRAFAVAAAVLNNDDLAIGQHYLFQRRKDSSMAIFPRTQTSFDREPMATLSNSGEITCCFQFGTKQQQQFEQMYAKLQAVQTVEPIRSTTSRSEEGR